MAEVCVKNIGDISVSVIPHERRFNAEGDFALDSRVREMYEAKSYDSHPKTQEEADARGLKHFNGLVTSVPHLHNYIFDGRNFLTLNLAPTRYLVGQAMRDCVKDGDYSEDEIQIMSPDMLGVSLLVPVKLGGEYFLMSQIKGKALGSGQIHTALVAGNIDAKYLGAPNPLITALQTESSEELGLDLSHMNSTSFIYLLDERETGQINLASVAMNANVVKILNAYESLTQQKLRSEEDLEVMALARLQIAGLALTPLEDGSTGIENIKCFLPSKDGLIESVETRPIRPYTEATVQYLSDPENVKFLLEKAGF